MSCGCVTKAEHKDCLGVSCAVSKKSTELRKAQPLWPGEACLPFGKLVSIPGECLVSTGQVELGISILNKSLNGILVIQVLMSCRYEET